MGHEQNAAPVAADNSLATFGATYSPADMFARSGSYDANFNTVGGTGKALPLQMVMVNTGILYHQRAILRYRPTIPQYCAQSRRFVGYRKVDYTPRRAEAAVLGA